MFLYFQVEASDNDEGDNARVAYSIYHISNNGAERFAIDPETGELRVMTPVDAGEQFSITVQATDGGGLYTQGIIEVMVIPGPNLGGPIFTQDEYYAEVCHTLHYIHAVSTQKRTLLSTYWRAGIQKPDNPKIIPFLSSI